MALRLRETGCGGENSAGNWGVAGSYRKEDVPGVMNGQTELRMYYELVVCVCVCVYERV